MALSIASWNIDPNRLWFVRLADAGSNISVELYASQSDAEAQTDRQAHGNSTGFGSALPVTFTNDSGATYPVSLFQPEHAWHLLVSGQDGDTAKIFRVKEFVDLDEISHPIYRNSDLILARAAGEIDRHTHAILTKQIALGSHAPALEPGDIVRLDSSRRGKDEMLQVMEHRISGEVSDGGETRLESSLTVAGYLALRR